jgi:hypothetical protein
MIALLMVVAGMQGHPWRVTPATPTVGDTIVLERFIPTSPGAVARLRPLDPSDLMEPLGPPVTTSMAGGVRIRQPLALFAPGTHALAMPAIEITHPDGTVEVVLGDTAVVVVGSVIPDSIAEPRPMPSLGPLARPVRDLRRALLVPAVVVLVLLVWVAWWRRAPRPVVPAVAESPEPELPLMRWLGTGERRAVATLAEQRLRVAVAKRVPSATPQLTHDEWVTALRDAGDGWPVEDLADLVAAFARARFAPLGADDLAELVDRVDVLVAQLPAPAVAETP